MANDAVSAGCAGVEALVARLDAAVALDDAHAITARVKANLEDLLGRGGLWCVEGVVPAADGRYREEARHLSYHS